MLSRLGLMLRGNESLNDDAFLRRCSRELLLDIDEESLTSLMVFQFGKKLVEVLTIVSPAIYPVPRSLPVFAVVLFNYTVLEEFKPNC